MNKLCILLWENKKLSVQSDFEPVYYFHWIDVINRSICNWILVPSLIQYKEYLVKLHSLFKSLII